MITGDQLNTVGQGAGVKFSGGTISNFLSGDESIVSFIFIIAGLALLLYLLSGGFKLMTSTGDPKKIQEAKSTITNALVGFVVVFVSYWLVQLVGIIFGLDQNPNWPF